RGRVWGGLAGGQRLYERGPDDAHLLQHLALDAGGDLRMVPEVVLGVLPALPDPLPLVGVPGPALLHDVLGGGEVEQVSLPGDAGAVHDVELDLLEGRGDL